MNSFEKEILENLETKKPIIFDVGCFNGNFSRKINQHLNISKKNFYLFDANKNLKISDFSYYNEIFAEKIKIATFYYNEFFPPSGSSLKKDTKDDKFWNFTRKIITLSPNKNFKEFKVKTNTLDNFCREKKNKEN